MGGSGNGSSSDANVSRNSGGGNESESVGKRERDFVEYDPSHDEPADYGELDYDYTSVEEKIAAGTRAKERGNALYRSGEYEKAWKEYDRAFVHIYTSKEEWEAIGEQWRNAINEFKHPCHLNRGLCRLKRDDLENALWDFTEALRIRPDAPKALYRRALVCTRLVENALAHETAGETWNTDVAQTHAEQAKSDLLTAFKSVPNDKAVRDAIQHLKNVRSQLKDVLRKYSVEQKKLYRGLIANLDEANRKSKQKEDAELFKNMPKLERVRLA